ncbi:unnamed protein product [Linum trigynum]|uniref:DDE Tnp4 domain-containing protein n=1 Tax=Linum trigynum TaxID=586398 RepID=A0AAV2G6V3_9ROSI
MNILGVVDQNMEFIYCLAGNWEGSSHDGRILRDALIRPNGLKVPRGYYCLCDAGYSNCEGFLSPFRGQRYHLKECVLGGGGVDDQEVLKKCLI